jgi:hypothetical protein
MIKTFNTIKTIIVKNFYYKKFEKHNIKVFNKFKNFDTESKSLILVEFNAFCVEHIGFSYLINSLKKKYNSKLESYFSHTILSYPLRRTLSMRLKFFLGKLFKTKNFGIYNSLGITKFNFPKIEIEHETKAKKIYNNFLKKKNTREKILKLQIDDIPFGDLLYDSFLKKNYDLKPTIFLDDIKFLKYSYDFILYLVIWLDYFKKNDVKAIIGSHCVYSIGIPLRIAIYKNIEAFVINSENLSRLTKKNPLQYGEFHTYNKDFKKINFDKKITGVNIAKKKLIARLEGKFSPDYQYATKSPFKKTKFGLRKIIKKSNRIKLVIATHDFVDAPHTLGNSLFPDFYQWLVFLGKLSRKTNYDWYIKTHIPYGGKFEIYQPHERNVVKKFVKDYPNFTIIPAKTTFPEIISNKIDAILTVNGTVGSEIPYYGIAVINASLNNPHINYNFNIHPKNKFELKEIIKNFTKYKKKLKINKKEIFEHYFMRNIYYDKNWLFENHNKFINDIGYHDQWSYKVYKYWIKKFSLKKHNELVLRVDKFVNSNEYRLRTSNY